MSASKDKKIRKQQIEAGTDKRTLAKEKEQKQHRKTKITYSIVTVLLVVFFVFIFTYNSTFPNRHTTAVTIDGKDYTVAQMNFYYSNAYMNFYNSNYNYVSMGLFFDPQTSLDEQQYSEDMTWRDYFLNTAVENMRQVQMLNDQAEAAGFELPAEYEDDYNTAIDDMVNGWKDLGYSSLQQYINLNYGKGVDEEMVRTEMRKLFVASAYSESLADSYEYSVDELNSYYTDHADELDLIEYAYYSVTDSTAEDDAADGSDEVASADAIAAPAVDAQALAEAIDGTDLEEFTAQLGEAAEGAAPTTQTLTGASLSSNYAEWLLDSARMPGDATSIKNEDSGVTYVVMFLSRDDNSYKMADFRHILVNAVDEDGDGAFSEDEIAAAADSAQDIYEEWQAGDATEDSFAELANDLSDDGGSNTNGGLYENVYKNQMVPPINDWLFEEGREPGDTTVVSYDGANYTGSHVVYYVGESDLTYAQYQADAALRAEAYNSWLEENLAGYEATMGHIGMAGKNH